MPFLVFDRDFFLKRSAAYWIRPSRGRRHPCRLCVTPGEAHIMRIGERRAWRRASPVPVGANGARGRQPSGAASEAREHSAR